MCDMLTRSGRVIRAPIAFDLAAELRRLEERRIEMEERGLDPFETAELDKEGTVTAHGGIPAQRSPSPHGNDFAHTIPDPSPTPITANASLSNTSPKEAPPPRPKHPKAAKRAGARGPSREARKRKRDEVFEQMGVPFKRIALKKGADAASQAKRVTFEPGKIRVAKTGWHGVLKGRMSCKTYSLAEAEAEGLEVIEWDGIETIPVVAAEDEHCLLILAGAPLNDPKYQAKVHQAEGAMDATREAIRFTPKERNNIRGTSPACAMGLSHGGGQTFYAPRAYNFQSENLKKLVEHYPHLKLNFESTAFAACTFNFGPHFISYPHYDGNNSAFTWCAVTAMGALFRWVDNGFMKAETWWERATDKMKAQQREEDRERVANGWKMFSTLEEIWAQCKQAV
ncbi:hypothetical protein V5O48_016985 [Marasmius crinis-equi]|uniref:Uncharacterized protein n=1 Tax=Marasmius crinis-equi TaxID=585013 RepID=A0ABR3EQ77_9AGAR